jgi:hypothetical protein
VDLVRLLQRLTVRPILVALVLDLLLWAVIVGGAILIWRQL